MKNEKCSALRESRQAAGLSQNDAAEALGVSRHAVRAFEVEPTRIPPPEVAERYAEMLGLELFEVSAWLGYLPQEDLHVLREASRLNPRMTADPGVAVSAGETSAEAPR